MSLPDAARRLFPHVADDDLSLERAEAGILERLLEDGDRIDLRWLTAWVPEERLARWVSERGSRQLSGRSRAFWSIVLDLPEPSRRPKGELLWPL